MPGSSPAASSPAAAAPPAPPAAPLGDNKAIKFHIKAGNSRWACTLQDRGSYERMKAARTSSMDSTTSADSSVASSAASPGSSSSP